SRRRHTRFSRDWSSDVYSSDLGSSIFSLSRPIIEATTSTPPIAPNKVACSAVGVDGSAVIATKPAKAPFNAMVKSALRNRMTDKIGRASCRERGQIRQKQEEVR